MTYTRVDKTLDLTNISGLSQISDSSAERISGGVSTRFLPAGSENPDNADLILYEDFDQRGRKLAIFDTAPGFSISDLRVSDFNDTVSSIEIIDKDADWAFFTDTNFRGESFTTRSGRSRNFTDGGGYTWNDVTSSLRRL